MRSASILDAALNRWPAILADLAGLTPQQLSNEHQPCPACGGDDRYRWDKDENEGSFFCNQCGGKNHQGGAGNGMDLLCRVKNWSFEYALKELEHYLDVTPVNTIASKRTKKTHRIPSIPPPNTPPPDLGNAIIQYPYGPDPANPWYWRQRIPLPPKPGKNKPGKYYLHRTWLDDHWHYPRVRGKNADTFTSEWPSPRPIYRLPQLLADTQSHILIVEGEPAAEAAAILYPNHIVLSWDGGKYGVKHTDWSPISSRNVILWPDADDDGKQAMATLASILLKQNNNIQIVKLPPNIPSGWDLADANDWTIQQASNVLLKSLQPINILPQPDQPTIEPSTNPIQSKPTTPDISVFDNAPFTCLGFEGNYYFYQPKDTGQVKAISGSGHSSTALLQLARDTYWETIYPSKTGINWTAAISSLFAKQAAVGVYNPDNIRGRGAWWDQNRCILHLGDRLIVDGINYSVMKPPKTKYIYQRLASIDIPTDLLPLTDQEGAEILDIASRFHWEVPASGLLLAGWAALAPICGALSWRPHVWLTAAAGSGKSAILDRFLGPLLDSFALWPEGNTTEAFIRQKLKADAIPVVFDEAESNEKADQLRIQNILALARVASSSGRGVIGKGGIDGAAQQFNIRSMFLLCSISTALKQGADQSRFSQLTLKDPKHLPKSERIAHWHQLDIDLSKIITTETGYRLLLRSVNNIPIIRESVYNFRRAAADRFDSQRQGDQYGTLLAGAWSLMNTKPASIEDALILIDNNDWQPYNETTETDQERCLQYILQHQLRVEIERTDILAGKVFSKSSVITRTIWELIEAILHPSDQNDITSDAAESHLGRIGLRVKDGRLLVANNALGLQSIIRETPWAHSLPAILSRLPGSIRAGQVRFRGLSAPSRAVSIPLEQP